MGHDLAATRRVRKGVLPKAASEPRPPAVEAQPTPSAEPSLVGPEITDAVVADVRHEVGNYLHKLYYWADFLTESRTGRAADVTATQMLDETIRGLEELLRVTLEYVRPLGATPMSLAGHEVADGIVRQLTTALGGRVVRTTNGGVADGWTVAIDPGRFSQLLAAIARRVDASTTPGAALELAVTVDAHDGRPLLVARLVGVGDLTGASIVTEVEWATAQNLARLVGGNLSVDLTGDRRVLVLAVGLRR